MTAAIARERSPVWERRTFGVAAGWIALAGVAQSLVIGLRAPGAWEFGFRPAPALLGPFAVESLSIVALAIAGAGIVWRRFGAELRAAGFVRPLLVGLAWVALTTLVTRSAVDYGVGLALTAAIHLAGASGMALAAGALPVPPSAAPMADVDGRVSWLIALGCATFATLAAAMIATVVFHRVPHVPDDVAYLFQARTYASGRTHLAPPPAPALFDEFLTTVFRGRWFSIFPPGWPMVLALGVLAGGAWLVNPVLAGIGILLLHAIVARAHDRWTANMCAILFASSPLYLFVSGTYMSHTFSIVCALVAVLSVMRLRSGGGLVWAVAGGAAIGMLFITRPIEGVSIGAFAGALALGLFGPRVRWSALATATVVAGMIGALFLMNNRLLTGSALRDPIQLYFDRTYYPGSNTLGFGADKGNVGWANDIFPGHSPVEAAIHVDMNLNIIDAELFGWLGGGLLFVALLALAPGAARARELLRSERTHAGAWIVLILAVVLPTTLYWYSGADLGPRYWYQTLVPLTILTALGVRVAARWLAIDRQALAAVVVTLALIGAIQNAVWRGRGKYHDYRGMRAGVGDLIRRCDIRDALVLVRGAGPDSGFGAYGSAFIWNSVPLGDGPVLAREGTPAQLDSLREGFPGREQWIVAAPARATDSYRVVSAPAGARCL